MVQYDVKRVQKGVQSFMVSFDFNKTPITQIADYIIIAASKHKSSDIHFDPRDEGMMVRFRMDGDLQDYTFIPKAYERNLTTRLKLLANMNITESRLPQDGAIKGDYGGKYLDMRVSALPTNEGEKIVIRILDYERSLQGVDTLGFHPDNLEKIKRFMHLPNGIILTTGATGSGKSTTTYSILQEINKPEKNIITVEDPIEMNIEGINQVQVNAEIGMTFAAALRSILRQDPNIVLIGEIRDSETAQIAIRTAITGHLVLSTIHTNNALATVERLLDMDVERYLLSTALSGIISQRLGKMICPDCRYQRETTKYEKKIFKRHLHKDVPTIWDANPKGCENCHKGYKGRIAFHEVLELDDEIRDALNNENLEKDDLRKLVYTNKTITMLQDALIKCLDGKTSFEEVYNAIEIESEEGDNYEEEMDVIEEEAPQEPEVQVSDDLLEEPINTNNENSVNVQVTIPELEAEQEALMKQMSGETAEAQNGQAAVQQPQANSPIPTVTQPTAQSQSQAPVQTPAVQQPQSNSPIPTVTQPPVAQQPVAQPQPQTQNTTSAIPTLSQTTEVNQQAVPTPTQQVTIPAQQQTVGNSAIPTLSQPTVVNTSEELQPQPLQPTTVKPVLQDQNQNVQIPSVTTTTTNPNTIQRLGETI